MYDVITVGSSTIDVFANVDSELIKLKTKNSEEELIAYPSGSKILIKSLNFLTGGGGTNTAAAFSKLGLKTAYLGKIGSGTNSRLIIKRLKKLNIDFIGVHSKKHHAGYSIILDSLDGDRTILTYKGANNFLRFNEIRLDKIKCKWLYFSSMVCESYKTLERLAEYAKNKKIKVAFNPSNYLAEKGYGFLKNLLKNTNVLVLNKEEAELLAGKAGIKKTILKIMEMGPKTVVVTDGKNGSYTMEDNNLVHADVFSKKKPLETTGAGDAFASTFLAGIIKKKNIRECLQMASINAGSLIMKKGAKNGLLSMKEIIKLLKSNAPKITVVD